MGWGQPLISLRLLRLSDGYAVSSPIRCWRTAPSPCAYSVSQPQISLFIEIVLYGSGTRIIYSHYSNMVSRYKEPLGNQRYRSLSFSVSLKLTYKRSRVFFGNHPGLDNSLSYTPPLMVFQYPLPDYSRLALFRGFVRTSLPLFTRAGTVAPSP